MIRNLQAFRRQGWLLAAPFLIILAGLGLYALATLTAGNPDRLQVGIERGYTRAWEDLDRVAEQAVSKLGGPPADEPGLLAAFQTLSAVAIQAELPGLSIYLLDPQGNPTVWSGAGIVHDLGPRGPLVPGREFLASFSSVSLLSVVSLRPWRRLAPGRRKELLRRWVALLDLDDSGQGPGSAMVGREGRRRLC